MNDGTTKTVWDPRDLIEDVFSDPQRLNPGKIQIVRTIRQGARDIDAAVFRGNRAEYTITENANGSVTVSHTGGPRRPRPDNDGTDTLLNIEVLQFANTSIVAPGARATMVPNNLVGVTLNTATNRINNALLNVGTVTIGSSLTVPAGRVISSDPPGGTFEFIDFPVNLVISNGLPDTIPPTVTFTSPLNGAGVQGSVAVAVDATDNIGVVGVQFFVDGNPLGAEDKVAPYTRSWATGPRGTQLGAHTLTAVARDVAGNTTTVSVNVTVIR
jgi:Bacterial Ig domain/PASTA domain